VGLQEEAPRRLILAIGPLSASGSMKNRRDGIKGAPRDQLISLFKRASAQAP
jgi:hypothetical protein